MPTVQFLISHERLLSQYIDALDATGLTLTADQKTLWMQILEESHNLVKALQEFGIDQGSGFYPNTFVSPLGKYRKINNIYEETLARAAGWVVATFPQTMEGGVGRTNLTVHNAIEKDQALDAGYSLPGIPPAARPKPKPILPAAKPLPKSTPKAK